MKWVKRWGRKMKELHGLFYMIALVIRVETCFRILTTTAIQCNKTAYL